MKSQEELIQMVLEHKIPPEILAALGVREDMSPEQVLEYLESGEATQYAREQDMKQSKERKAKYKELRDACMRAEGKSSTGCVCM
jgi:transcriptional regulator of NAD metabolism